MNSTHQYVSLDLMEFIETSILPRYAEFDKAHNLSHATSVIKRSVELAKMLGADIDMAYTIAAYHDLGLEGPRAIHHLTSGKILMADARLKRWFSADQIKLMKEAVEDHRASAFRRTIQFGISHYPEKSKEEQWERFMEHMQNKYSSHGYIKLWLPNSPNAKQLNEIRAYIAEPNRLRPFFDRLFEEEKE